MKINILKKVLVFGILFILFWSGFVSGSNENEKSSEYLPMLNENINNEYFLEDYHILTPFSIDLFKNSIDISEIELIDTPDEFSWKNFEGKDWTTPTKNQGNCGSCGVFAAIGALESVINIKEGNAEIDPDFSEQYVLSCLPAAALTHGEGCSGGMGYTALELMMNTTPEGNYYNGALFDSCFPYEASDDIPCENKCSDWIDNLVPIMDCGQIWAGNDSPENRELIKSLILEKGPVGVYMQVPMNPNTFHNWGFRNHKPTDYFPYREEDLLWLNHEVMLLGWKDDSSIGNGGYWIGKNSWGTNWGYDGFFNIEYGSCYIGYVIEWADYDPFSYDWGPNLPSIEGPKFGRTGQEYKYIFTTTDPDGDDDFYLYIDWGDGNIEEWIGPYESDEIVNVNHTWENKKFYNIRVKAKDINNKESNWNEQSVIITRNRKTTIPLINEWLESFIEHFKIFIYILSLLVK
jgi:C1A family cysteine protease